MAGAGKWYGSPKNRIDQRFVLPRNNEAGEQYEDQIENL
jgi:hypothetical protein